MLSKAAGVTTMVSNKKYLTCMWQSISTNILQAKFWEWVWPLNYTNSKPETSLCAYHYNVPETHFRNAKHMGALLVPWELGMLSEGWVGNISKISCLLIGCRIWSIDPEFFKSFQLWSCCPPGPVGLQHAFPLTLMAFGVTQGRGFWALIQTFTQRWKRWRGTACLWAH